MPRTVCSPPAGYGPHFDPATQPPAGQFAVNHETQPASGRRLIAIYLGLALLTWGVFGQTLNHQFVEFDDQNYVYENQRITAGLTISGIIGAFIEPHAQNWHPLTTISHMVDCQLWGLTPGGHHLTNVLLHATVVLLLFSALNAMTGSMWRSALVAALFAIHPLRAESVAWVSERKDVLSGVFFMLTLIAYLRYVRDQRLSRYLVTLVCFALALMAKPTVVTLPLLLLLLDYWPLGRIGAEPIAKFLRRGIFIEKIPFLALATIVSVVTVLVQRQTVGYSQVVAITDRLGNAAWSYVAYLGQFFWPANLAVFYPHVADHTSSLSLAISAVILIGISVLVAHQHKRRKYLVTGWTWFVVAMLPVIGLVQVGLQGRADRYTYLPHIGLFIATVWLIGDAPVLKLRFGRRIAPAIAVALIMLLAWRGYAQTATWRDTETLWRNALRSNEANDVAHNNLATMLMRQGRLDEAIDHYQTALRVGAGSETHTHLSPAIIHNSLGNALAVKGDVAGATDHYRAAAELRPELADARTNLAAMLRREGNLAQAIAEYQEVVAVPPFDSASQQRLAAMLAEADRMAEAVVHYRRALELNPDSLDALNALAWILATTVDSGIRNPHEALQLANRANRLTGGDDPVVLRILAASFASAGRLSEASSTAQRALFLAGANEALVRALEAEIERYRSANRSQN
ncbi:MAG TPA: tetratricopeptide repeat protein [Chthoniobacterales bacterium]|nr:tetratricopeptide repeat protein [Chthoniobacterales bacterium]